MEYHNKEFCLEVWGDMACFTRPEMKVERVSYDVITPSAARAVFEAIFWKPAIEWRVKKIEVLNPIKWTSVRRNEIGSLMSHRSDGIYIEEARQQKAGLLLKDVHYRITAELVFIPMRNRAELFAEEGRSLVDAKEQEMMRADENPGKYNAMFERRARKGQCFTQPYLGCREFSASFKLVESPLNERLQPISESKDLGFMLFDMDFTNKNNPQAMFYRVNMNNGVIHVPEKESEEVLR